MDLETNCLLCRASVKHFENAGYYIPWMEDVAVSLCEILDLEQHFQQLLQTAVYCDACLFTIRDIDFTLKNVNALQHRLQNCRLRVSTLLKDNYVEVDLCRTEKNQGLVNVDDNEEDCLSYEKVVTSIWDALSADNDKKPDLSGNRLPGRSRSSFRIPSRQRQTTVTTHSQEFSDSDPDYYPDIEPLVKIETDFPTPRKRNRKNPTPVKVGSKSLAQRKKDLKARQKKSKEFKCYFAKCKYSTADSVKYAKHLKRHEGNESETSDDPGARRDDLNKKLKKKQYKARRTNKQSSASQWAKAKKFVCSFEDCKFSSIIESRFQVHCRVHEGDEKPHHCKYCKEAKFATNAPLYYHQRYSCPANPDRHKQKNTIRTPKSSADERRPCVRVDSDTGEEESGDENPTQEKIEFKCTYEGCDFSTKAERRYQCHIRIHEGDSLPYWCNSCDKKFPKAKHLNLHKHRNCGDVFTCPVSGCDSVFPNRTTVKTHMNTFHYKDGKNICEHCSKVFELTEEEAFNTHKGIHEVRMMEGRKFSCIVGECISMFTNSIDLKAHVLQEHETSSSKCEVCQAVLANPISLKRHMSDQHGPTNPSLQCDKCPFIAKHPCKLKIHMNKHSATKLYVCNVEGCGKEFNWPASLRTHMVVHTGVNLRKFKCTFENCEKAFVTTSKLRDHEETHSDRHSYFCDRCAKSFKAKKNLKQHFRYVHNVGYTSVKSARRERQRLAEAGLDVSEVQAPSNAPKSRSKKRSQSASKTSMAKYAYGKESEEEEMNEGGGSHGGSEVDVALGSGNWTFPPQHIIGAHTQQFLNPSTFYGVNNPSLYFNG